MVSDAIGRIDTARIDVIVLENPYVPWIGSFGFAGTNALMNSDPGGLENLAEYGLGGIPNLGNDSVIPTFGASTADPQIFEYIYRRRDAEDRGLTYYLEISPSLIPAIWNTSGYGETGSALIDTNFKAVINAFSTSDTNGFVRLRIKKN